MSAYSKLPKVSELPPEIFDGIKEGYIPGENLHISPKLKLHQEWTNDIDPITYEVIRHNLWNINEEHGATIQRISGSPVAIYAFDLNPTILTEDGEFVFFGPYMQYMSGVADTQVKWILENRSDNPGINDGDMFIANDPWVGAAHQMDVMLICPVFSQGKLFCWITNCLHQHDIGGITPGSFCPSARDVYDEGIILPPTRIVEKNEIRRDIEELYLRASREPSIVALDLRAQVAGNSMARDRILSLIRRYGPEVIKGVMKKILSNGEQAFLEKLSRLPDGEWRERTYVECCRPGDRNVYPVYLTLRKKGNHLTFENEGTALQDGAMNATYSGWRGSLIIAINQILCWDQYFAVGGALRHVTFDPTPGTFTCARHPASVSTAPVQAMEISLYPTYNVLAKMVYCDPLLRKDIMCIGGTSQFPTVFFQGINQRGEKYGLGLIDPLGGAIGAFACADGISTGGQSRTPISRMPNIEHTEQLYPMLILSRREIPDSGGAGKFRGGMSAEVAFIPHNTDCIIHNTVSSGNAVPTSIGLMGGHPGMTNIITFAEKTNVLASFEEGFLLEGNAEIGGKLSPVELRQVNFHQHPGEVFTVGWSAGAGFGDPLDRDPNMVAADVATRTVSLQAAKEIYGVMVDAASYQVNHKTTESLRKAIRAYRLEGVVAAGRILDGAKTMELTEQLHLRETADCPHYCCAQCDTDLGPVAQDYKASCHIKDLPLGAANPLIGDPRRFVDAVPVFRAFICPGCGTMIDTEICLEGDQPLRDIRLFM